MQFVLDFDRVLFDTDSFSVALEAAGLDLLPRGPELLCKIETAGIDWHTYVHVEAEQFLQKYGQDSVIVSSYFSRNRGDNVCNEADLAQFQEAKIHRSGLADLVRDVLVVGEEKQAVLQSLSQQLRPPIVFLDDELVHIEAARQLGFRAIWFRTPKNISLAPPSPQVETVRSFENFIDLVHHD